MCSSHVLKFNEESLTNITELLGYEFDTDSGELGFFYACKWSLQLYYFICCIFQ